MTIHIHLDGLVLALLGVLSATALGFAPKLNQRRARRRKLLITDSNRAIRDRRANVVRAMDAASIAYALGPREAELRGLQHWVDALARYDRKDVDR